MMVAVVFVVLVVVMLVVAMLVVFVVLVVVMVVVAMLLVFVVLVVFVAQPFTLKRSCCLTTIVSTEKCANFPISIFRVILLDFIPAVTLNFASAIRGGGQSQRAVAVV